MSTGWKPLGYSTVSVYLVVQSTQQMIDVRKKTFDASDLRRVKAPDGRIMHAELVALRSRNQYGKKVIRIGVGDLKTQAEIHGGSQHKRHRQK